ncbi:transposase [Brucella cytisi]|uniref:IS66 family transposase n=1 Tax=Brucella cytisi TaxID=407152 RepID=UPI00313F0FDC
MPATPGQVKQVETIRDLIWRFYKALKAYRQKPDARLAAGLEARFDRIFAIRTGYDDLDKLLLRLSRRKAELLRVLDRPEIPLNTNASENDLRSFVIKRKISGGTMSRDGRIARDTLLGLMKTCQKLGLSFWHYLGDRLEIGSPEPTPPLATLIAARASTLPSPFEPGTLTARKISAAARIGPAEIAYAFDTATEFAPLTHSDAKCGVDYHIGKYMLFS